MERTEMLELWNDMWKEGNWIPSWPDSLAGLTATDAAWTPYPKCHSIWEEVVHIIFWRDATLKQVAGEAEPTEEEINRLEFAPPSDVNESTWATTFSELKRTHDEIEAALKDEAKDVSRVKFHLIHDGYHLGRITQLRAMQGSNPKF